MDACVESQGGGPGVSKKICSDGYEMKHGHLARLKSLRGTRVARTAAPRS